VSAREAGIAWRAHLLSVGARAALVCAADARERSGADADLLDAVLRQLAVRAGQRAGASVRRIKAAEKDLDADALAASLGADYVATLDAEVSDERLRVALALTATARELPSHSRRFEQLAAERLRFVDETAESVLEDVCDLLDERVRRGMRDWGTRSLLAYRHAVTADLYANRDISLREQAATSYRLALSEDPQLASAYLELTRTLVSSGDWIPEATRARSHEEILGLIREARLRGIASEVIREVGYFAARLSKASPYELEELARREIIRGGDPAGTYSLLLCGARLFDEADRYLDRAVQLAGDSRWSADSAAGYGSAIECRAVIADARGDFEAYLGLVRKHLELFPYSTNNLFALTRVYAILGRYAEAEATLVHLDQASKGTARHARLLYRTVRGELSPGGEEFEAAIAHPRNLNVVKGNLCFAAGDVERGIRFWRAIEPSYTRHLWFYLPEWEQAFAAGVIADPLYQALLDELGFGPRWRRYLWERARELTEVTGISVTTPRPPEHYGNGRAAASALELLPYGVIGLAADGRVVFANSVAHGLLTARRGLRTLGTNLVADDPTASAQLREAIARAASTSHAANEPTLVRCPRRSSARALQVLVAPAQSSPALALDRAERSARVVVIVSDPDDAPLPDASVLERLFDLTPTQARLAAAIASGLTSAEYADEYGVRVSTARQQLKELMARVGVHRQAELVRVLLSGVVQLRTGARS
jgi:DNA-binding CsgD family transcriptional regulator/tetratricopeptide (TPR) repeat protein